MSSLIFAILFAAAAYAILGLRAAGGLAILLLLAWAGAALFNLAEEMTR